MKLFNTYDIFENKYTTQKSMIMRTKKNIRNFITFRKKKNYEQLKLLSLLRKYFDKNNKQPKKLL